MTVCAHCGTAVAASAVGSASVDAPAAPSDPQFCCLGCAAAYRTVRGLGLESYYRRRCVDPTVRPLRPDPEAAAIDYSAHVQQGADGLARLHLMVEGLHCAACVWLIESILTRQRGVTSARLNMTTHRLTVAWRPEEGDVGQLTAAVTGLGYHLMPFDPERLHQAEQKAERELLVAMAVAGFAAGNVMLASVAVWAGHVEGMGPATRGLMHWVSALIALPAIIFALRPFARAAFTALRAGRTSMEVPITVGVTLCTAMSLFETIRGGPYAYFDSALALLFFLLIGRALDQRARGRARTAAEHLLALQASAVRVLESDGRVVVVPADRVVIGMTVLVAAGERVPVDGTVADGISDLDTALISGETVPATVKPGDRVFAGTVNLSAPLRLTVAAIGEGTLLGEIVRLMEVAEQGRARYVAVADRIARYYTPVVHAMALATFAAWHGYWGLPWQEALMIAVTVLIITCPCALALAVPVVQVIATGRLLRQGILTKSATALERLAKVDTIVFDKTGTLTEGDPEPDLTGLDAADLRLAASLAGASRHPLAQALVRAVPGVPVAAGVREVPGAGLALDTADGEVRLGSRRFIAELGETAAAAAAAEATAVAGPELWLARPGALPSRVGFRDRLRADAAEVTKLLRNNGMALVLLSGDRRATVAVAAAACGITDWQAEQSPADKTRCLAALAARGRTTLMVGDGLNDAPALAAATVSMSPSTAADVSQTAADLVFQGRRLMPVAEVLAVAVRAERLVRQNFALALLYNVFTVPLAVAGMVTPLIAALAMSSSSILVTLNALRLSNRRRGRKGTHDRDALPDRRGHRDGTDRVAGVPVGPEVGPVR